MQTENRVVLLTDMKGFAVAAGRQTRDETTRMLALHDALLLPVIRAFRGTRVKSIGDASLVLFEAPTDALRCGIAIQDRLWDYARRVSEAQRIEVRVAVALGEVRIAKSFGADDLFGEAVNLVSRIEGEAESGEVWFSEAVYWVMDRTSIAWEDMGSRKLKGFPEEVRLFRVAREQSRAEPPYGNAGLSFVVGLPPPEPEALAKQAASVPAREQRPRWPAAFLAILLLASAGLITWRVTRPGFDDLVRAGRLDDAELFVGAIAATRGIDDPVVSSLEQKLEKARAPSGGRERRSAFDAWSRGLAEGSPTALDWLWRQARSPSCERQRLAARALWHSGARAALAPLRELASTEPPLDSSPWSQLARALFPKGRCGAGDIARAALPQMEKVTAQGTARRPAP